MGKHHWLLAVSLVAALGGCREQVVHLDVGCEPGQCGDGRICHEERCVSLCNSHADCPPSEACQDGACLPGERPDLASCPPLSVTVGEPTPSDVVWVGYGVDVTAAASGFDEACPLTSSGWSVCAAPPESTYFVSVDEGGCLSLTTEQTIHFDPDRAGEYELRYHAAHAQSETAQFVGVRARAETIFADVIFVDDNYYRDLAAALADSDDCVTRDEEDCHDGCVWREAEGYCTVPCEALEEAACFKEMYNTGGACDWQGSSCVFSGLALAAVCAARDEARCAQQEACVWRPARQICTVACAQLDDDTTSCIDVGCGIDPVDRCYDRVYAQETTAPVTVSSDGGELTLLRTAKWRYRYDPNGVFVGTDPIGVGMPPGLHGMAYDAGGTALLPANYLMGFFDDGLGGYTNIDVHVGGLVADDPGNDVGTNAMATGWGLVYETPL